MTQKRLLVVAPHPDDGEVFAHQLIVHGIKAGYEVHQLLFSCDEYGIVSPDEFKGKRIQRIRRSEMIHAAKAYGLDPRGHPLVHLHWANYIDLHVPFNKSSVARLTKFIKGLSPEIIVGPDPFLQYDAHPDHLATGRTYYFALKKMSLKERPKMMLFFQTTRPQFFLPLIERKKVSFAQSHHKSQFTPLNIKFLPLLSILFSIISARKGHFHLTQGFRYVSFQSQDHFPKSLIEKFLSILIGSENESDISRVSIPPQELGLETSPKGDII